MTLTATHIFILFQQQYDVETYFEEMFHCTSPIVTLKEKMFQISEHRNIFLNIVSTPNNVETFLTPRKFFVSTAIYHLQMDIAKLCYIIIFLCSFFELLSKKAPFFCYGKICEMHDFTFFLLNRNLRLSSVSAINELIR